MKRLASERLRYWPGYCKYIILIEIEDFTYQQRLELMQYLWQMDMNNIILISTMKPKNIINTIEKNWKMEIFYPYTKNHCKEFQQLKVNEIVIHLV